MMSVLTWSSHHFRGKSSKRNWKVRIVFLSKVWDLDYQCLLGEALGPGLPVSLGEALRPKLPVFLGMAQ